MSELKPEQTDVSLYSRALEAFENNRHLLAIGDKPALTKEEHSKIAIDVDKRLSEAIKTYLPRMIPFCQQTTDLVGVVVGLAMIDEIKGIPKDVLPFIARGVWIAPEFVVKEPKNVSKLLRSVNENGYPTGGIADYFFKRPNRFGKELSCAGILSAMEILRVLYANHEKTEELVSNENMIRYPGV